MKVAICGTQCIGKSTFIDDIIKELPQFKKPSYTYRDAIRDAGIEGQINRKTCQESQKIIFEALVKEVEASGQFTIHDRSIMDNVAYSTWPLKYDKENTDITQLFVTSSRSAAKKIMDHYDLIVYIELDDSIPIEDDQFRDVDPNYRRQMAKIMETLYLPPIDSPDFDKYGYKVITVSGSRQERVEKFKEIIKALT